MLSTHILEIAERMCDRIGIINKGELVLVEQKSELMRKLGRKQLTLQLQAPLRAIPAVLAGYGLELADNGNELTYTYEAAGDRSPILPLLEALDDAGIRLRDLHTTQSSLEDIFVSLVREAQ